MMKFPYEVAVDHLSTYTYKPGWKFLLAPMEFQGSIFYELTIVALVQDAYYPDRMIPVQNRRVLDPFYINDLERLNEFVHREIQRLEWHEIDEWFKINGKHYRDPHPEDLQPKFP